MIVVVFGLPGTGKSYFATALAARLGVIYLSTDELRRRLYKVPDYSPEKKLVVYDELLATLEVSLKNRLPVVVDGTAYLKSIRRKFVALAKKYGVPVYFIEVTVKEEIARERLAHPRSSSDADFNVYLRVRDEFEPMQENHLILDSEAPMETMVGQALAYINQEQ